MRGAVQPGNWALLSENREAVLAALLRGETDGIVPAASGFMDRFAQFLIKLEIPSLLDGWPDSRRRRSIAPFFFCNVMLHKSVFRLDSLCKIGPFLFSSPDVMRTLGFNMRQITGGFYSSGEQRPFNEEALSDFFASCKLSEFLSNQRQVLLRLVDAHPEMLEEGTLVIDCKDIRIPAGNRGRPQTHLEACVVSSRSHGELLPVLWSFIPANAQADISQGKAIVEEVLAVLGEKVKRLIMDRGFISGAWVTGLKEQGIDTVIGLKTDMVLYQDMVALSKLTGTIFSLLAYTLLRLFARKEEAHKKAKRPTLPSGGVELVCYWQTYYAIILPSLVIELVGRCPPGIRRRITEKLKEFESSLQ